MPDDEGPAMSDVPEAPAPRRAARSRRRDVSHRERWRISLGSGGGTRVRRERRRTKGLPGTMGWTVLGALVPGSGYLFSGRKVIGTVVLLAWLVVLGGGLYYLAGRGFRSAIEALVDPTVLKILAAVIAAGILVWAIVVLTSYRSVRPRERPRWHTAVGYLTALVVIAVGAVPASMAARVSLAQADLVETVFDEDPTSATTPKVKDKEDPWADDGRVNVLLLGGDGGEGRTGVRTDTVILASINTKTGVTSTFSLPRNMMNAQFPESSPLHDLYPDGYNGSEDDGFYMLNAVYGQIPERHPGVLGESDNEGADAIKQAVSGSLGIDVDYYLLVNLEGFKEVVDAMGGVTVNINEPIAIEGNTDAGIPPKDYLAPGKDRKLDGYEALWYSRGRWGSDDYERMERQRCMISAIIDAADPVTLFRRYTKIADAGKEVVYTDIPRDLVPAFVELGTRIQDADNIKSVVFKTSEDFSSSDPDFDWMQAVVQKTLYPNEDTAKKKVKSDGNKPKEDAANLPEVDKTAEKPVDACAYNPTGETVEDAIASDEANY